MFLSCQTFEGNITDFIIHPLSVVQVMYLPHYRVRWLCCGCPDKDTGDQCHTLLVVAATRDCTLWRECRLHPICLPHLTCARSARVQAVCGLHGVVVDNIDIQSNGKRGSRMYQNTDWCAQRTTASVRTQSQPFVCFCWLKAFLTLTIFHGIIFFVDMLSLVAWQEWICFWTYHFKNWDIFKWKPFEKVL